MECHRYVEVAQVSPLHSGLGVCAALSFSEPISSTNSTRIRTGGVYDQVGRCSIFVLSDLFMNSDSGCHFMSEILLFIPSFPLVQMISVRTRVD
jgi:hypothetical protein